MSAKLGRKLGCASAIGLMVALWCGSAALAHESANGCTLSKVACAKEGFVILGAHADRLVSWGRMTDHRPVRLEWVARPMDRIGSNQTVTLLLGTEDLEDGALDALIARVIERGGAVGDRGRAHHGTCRAPPRARDDERCDLARRR